MRTICRSTVFKFSIVTFIINLSCGQSPEQARQARLELGKLNIPYTERAFIEYVSNGDDHVVGLFLTAGMDVNVTDKNTSATPLFLACQEGHAEIVSTLLDYGANVNAFVLPIGTALFVASREGHTDIVKILLDKGADVNSRDILVYHTPLFIASFNGNVDIVKALLNKGADVNDARNDGTTFLTKGADDNSRNPFINMTALHIASLKGHIDIVEALLNNKADVNARTKGGWTPLHFVSFGCAKVEGGHTKVVELLLESDADVNAKDNAGQTPLFNASIFVGCEEILRLLKKAGGTGSISDVE